MRDERCAWWGIPVKTSAPVHKLTRALTGLTGCACLSAVALCGMRGIWFLNVLHLLPWQSEYLIDIGSVSGT